MKVKFRPEHYIHACQERIKAAWILYEKECYVSSIYNCGVAVECLLRAYIIKKHPQFDSRHDFIELLKKSGILEFIPYKKQKQFAEYLGEVWSRWKNDYRYASSAWLTSKYKKMDLYQKGDTNILKSNCYITYNNAMDIISIGVRRWPLKIN